MKDLKYKEERDIEMEVLEEKKEEEDKDLLRREHFCNLKKGKQSVETNQEAGRSFVECD